jgi:hypothetical protein
MLSGRIEEYRAKARTYDILVKVPLELVTSTYNDPKKQDITGWISVETKGSIDLINGDPGGY